MPSFTLRSARPYTKYCSYSTRISYDSDGYVDNGVLRLCCPSEPVSVYDWLKNGFVTHEVNAEAAHTPY